MITDPSSPSLRVYPCADSTVVVVVGDLDLTAAKALRRDLDGLLAAQPTSVLLDLSSVEFLDSSGVAMLLHLHNGVVGGSGGSVRVTSASRAAWKTLELCGLVEMFGIDPNSEPEAQ